MIKFWVRHFNNLTVVKFVFLNRFLSHYQVFLRRMSFLFLPFFFVNTAAFVILFDNQTNPKKKIKSFFRFTIKIKLILSLQFKLSL